MKISDMDRKTDLILFLQEVPLSKEVTGYCARRVHEVCRAKAHGWSKAQIEALIEDTKVMLSYSTGVSEKFIKDFTEALTGVEND